MLPHQSLLGVCLLDVCLLDVAVRGVDVCGADALRAAVRGIGSLGGYGFAGIWLRGGHCCFPRVPLDCAPLGERFGTWSLSA